MVAPRQRRGATVPILQHTDDRLRIACICFDAAGALIDLDRARNQMAVYRLALVVPVGRAVANLSEIAAVQVRKREHDDGSASYGLVLRLRHEEDVRFGCRSRDEAVGMMRLLTKFLNLEHA